MSEKEYNLNNDFVSEVSNTHLNLSSVSAYEVWKVTDTPMVRDKIEDCKETFKELASEAGEKFNDFCENVKDSVSDFCMGAYENVKDFVSDKSDAKELVSRGIEFEETRDFGINKCTDAALDIFNHGVINDWSNMTTEQRKDLAITYADEVAKAFELENYKGVIIEGLEPGVEGYNNGDGTIHLTDSLVAAETSPLNIIDTITHELRHQYQSEAIDGYHNVADNVRKEWTVADQLYNYNKPNCYDPWGYIYNPLEIDSRYAGETVVKNITNNIFNNLVA